MDLSILKKFRRSVVSIGTRLDDLDRRVHNAELLSMSESVLQSDNGIYYVLIRPLYNYFTF